MAEDQKKSFPKKEHFKSVQYVVVFMNTTTQTEVINPSKVKIVELGDDWVTLQVPSNSCNLEHRLLFHIMPIGDAKKLERGVTRKPIVGAISVTAQVKEMVEMNKLASNVNLKFLQYSQVDWKDFLSVWQSVQKDVDELVGKIRK